MRISIIGLGNLGQAIHKGLKQIKLQPKIRDSDTIFLCVKPKDAHNVLKNIHTELTPEKNLISCVLGLTTKEISQHTQANIIRAMPNIAVQHQKGLICTSGNIKPVQHILKPLGKIIEMDESLIQSATALNASGIAYNIHYLQTLINMGERFGFDPETAREIVTYTMQGALFSDPEDIAKVATPDGCTQKGFRAMEGYDYLVRQGLAAVALFTRPPHFPSESVLKNGRKVSYNPLLFPAIDKKQCDRSTDADIN